MESAAPVATASGQSVYTQRAVSDMVKKCVFIAIPRRGGRRKMP